MQHSARPHGGLRRRTSIAMVVAFVLGMSGRADASWFTGPCETTGCHVFRWTVAAPVFVVLGALWVVGTFAKGAAEGAAAGSAAQPVVVAQPQPMMQPLQLPIERMRTCTTNCTSPGFCTTTCM